jgi:hypothetical protein
MFIGEVLLVVRTATSLFLQENSSTSAAIIPAIKAFIPTCKAFSAIGRLLATVAIDILLSEASLSAEESSEISSRKDEAKIMMPYWLSVP